MGRDIFGTRSRIASKFFSSILSSPILYPTRRRGGFRLQFSIPYFPGKDKKKRGRSRRKNEGMGPEVCLKLQTRPTPDLLRPGRRRFPCN